MRASGVMLAVGAVTLALVLSACDDTYRRVLRPYLPYQPPCDFESPARLKLIPFGLPDSVQATHPDTRVSMRVRIDAGGAVDSVEFLTSPSPLDSFARAEGLASVWEPARDDSVAVTAIDTLTLYGCGPGDVSPSPSPGCFVYYEEAPRLVSMPAPTYPDSARAAGVEGTVKVQALLGLDGRVWCSRVVKSIPGLDEAAVDAVWLSSWLPALNNNSPIAVWAEVPVRFSLNGITTASP